MHSAFFRKARTQTASARMQRQTTLSTRCDRILDLRSCVTCFTVCANIPSCHACQYETLIEVFLLAAMACTSFLERERLTLSTLPLQPKFKSCLCSQIDVTTVSTTCRVTGPTTLALHHPSPLALKILVFPNTRTQADSCLASARADRGRFDFAPACSPCTQDEK